MMSLSYQLEILWYQVSLIYRWPATCSQPRIVGATDALPRVGRLPQGRNAEQPKDVGCIILGVSPSGPCARCMMTQPWKAPYTTTRSWTPSPAESHKITSERRHANDFHRREPCNTTSWRWTRANAGHPHAFRSAAKSQAWWFTAVGRSGGTEI